MLRLKTLQEKVKEEKETQKDIEIIPLNTDTESNTLISSENLSQENSLNKNNEDLSNVEFRVQSFFNIPTENHEKLFDFIYDYTFLCSFHPSVRTQWAEKMFDLLKHNGELCTLIFPIRSTFFFLLCRVHYFFFRVLLYSILYFFIILFIVLLIIQ